MKKPLAKKILLIIIIAMTPFVGIIAINEPIFMDSQQFRYPDILFSGYEHIAIYKFNPETILESLDKGETDVFKPPSLDTTDVQSFSHPFLWGQSNYLKIADALQIFVSNESTKDWILHDMSFYGDCTYNSAGFDIVTISFYKATGLQQYSARLIGIYPPIGEVQWGQGEKYPRSLFGGRKNIDIRKLEITVEEAIKLTEENGGKQARIAANNQCRIYATLGPYPYPEWSITYKRATNSEYIEIFDASIDPYTGEYEILTSPVK